MQAEWMTWMENEDRAQRYASVAADLRELFRGGHLDECLMLNPRHGEPRMCNCGFEAWLSDVWRRG